MTTVELACKAGVRSKTFLASLLVLSRPGIMSLVLLAGFAGMVMAAGGLPDASISLLTLLCLLFSAAGSAMINGVMDYHLDVKMARLHGRVEALRGIGRNRTIILALSMVVFTVIAAYRFLNPLTGSLIALAAAMYTIPYTLWLKRRSPFGAIPGAIPGALPALIGYAAVAGAIRVEAMLLFLIVLLWQPPHFWILALKHRDDYCRVGLPVLPAVRESRETNIFILAYATALLPASTAVGIFGTLTPWYQLAAFLLGSFFVGACYLHVVRNCRYSKAFRASIVYLFLYCLALIGDICLHGGAIMPTR